jgi:hypothetical protein
MCVGWMMMMLLSAPQLLEGFRVSEIQLQIPGVGHEQSANRGLR